MRPCDDCGKPCSPGNRLCPQCARWLLQHLDESGQLERRVWIGNPRSADAREDERETRRGTDR